MTTFTSDQLTQALAPRAVRYSPETGSTNDDAIDWLRAGAEAGSVVITDAQVQGRGRLGRVWYAPPGTALLMTVVLRPPVEHLTRLTMVGALAVTDTADSFGISRVGIKWPNDVRIGTRKLCGVLPEAAWEGSTCVGAVLGIGMNVNLSFDGTPYAETATSLQDALGAPLDRLNVLKRLLAAVDKWALRIASPLIYETWRSRLVTLGTHVQVQTPGGIESGLAEDVAPDGALLLRHDDGRLVRVVAGEIGV